MKLLRADYFGMCFGVRDAITLASNEAFSQPVTVLGELVHNETVLGDLRARGVRLERELEAVTTETVLITAHGASDRRIAEVRARGHRVVEATCPLVRHAHRSLADLVRAGFHPVIIGQRNHIEVRGLTEDYADHDLVQNEADIAALAPRPRFGVVAQTTQPIARVRELVDCLRRRFPESEVVFRDTVCQPTKQRQVAAEDLARQCDVVVVIGGQHSNNTRELVATCGRHCGRVHHVQTAGDLHAEWFRREDTVGLTAGTSTPDSTIQAVEAALNRLVESFRETAIASPSLPNAQVSIPA
jgi:4-hydroxy-3-methylbut-2-enyl diphosphate reductase